MSLCVSFSSPLFKAECPSSYRGGDVWAQKKRKKIEGMRLSEIDAALKRRRVLGFTLDPCSQWGRNFHAPLLYSFYLITITYKMQWISFRKSSGEDLTCGMVRTLYREIRHRFRPCLGEGSQRTWWFCFMGLSAQTPHLLELKVKDRVSPWLIFGYDYTRTVHSLLRLLSTCMCMCMCPHCSGNWIANYI